MIYLDNAATTPVDAAVLKRMEPYFSQVYGNPSSQHSAGRQAANALLSARDETARAAGCSPSEIYFTSGGSEACNTAVKGACLKNVKRGGHLAVSAIEHHAVIESALDMRAAGFDVTFIQPDKNGVITAEAVKSALRPDTVLCAVMHANNEIGTIQPVGEIYDICRAAGVFYFCDCVQTAGVLPFPEADALCFSAHKFYGPKGFGALVLKDASRISRLISGGGQERSFRGGTSDTAGAVGCAAALTAACAKMTENNAAVSAVRDRFVARALSEIDGVALNGGGDRLPGNANLFFEGCDGENILFCLDLEGVCASVGSACSAGAAKPSHVLTSVYSAERAKSSVRFSFGKYNTLAEADYAVEALKRAVKKIR